MWSSAPATQSTGTTFVLPRSKPDERHPLRHHLAHALDRLEEVVGTVDLVHLAGLGVAHNDPGPVHAPGHELLFAHRSLGLELGGVIGRGQPLPLVEEVLAELALVGARDRDRGDVVQASGPQRPSQFHRMVGAADVDRRVELHGRCHVIDGGEMEEMIDRPFEL